MKGRAYSQRETVNADVDASCAAIERLGGVRLMSGGRRALSVSNQPSHIDFWSMA